MFQYMEVSLKKMCMLKLPAHIKLKTGRNERHYIYIRQVKNEI